MRILLVSSYFPPHVGGVEVVVAEQARVLAADGHEVTVATTCAFRGELLTERRDGYRIRRLPARTFIERRWRIPYPVIGPAGWRTLRALVDGSDVVHVHDVLYQPSQVAAWWAVRAGKPLYATQHVGPVNHPHAVVRRVEGAVGAVAGGFIWGRARRVVAYNPMVADHLAAQGVPPERITAATIGVDLHVFTPGHGDDPGLRREYGIPVGVPVVLFVGRLVDKKGYQLLLRAAGPGYHVVFAGSGSPPTDVPSGVTFCGPQSPDQLLRWYRLASMFVLPSAGEVFPIAAREAMACGLPVILTDAPAYRHYDIDTSLLRLITPDPAAIRRSVTDILADDPLRRRMAAYCRRFAGRHFDAAAVRAALLHLYDPPAAKEPQWT